MGGTLEFIQKFQHPEIIDASDSSLEINCSLRWSTNCSVVPLKSSSGTVLVTYWVSLLFSEAPLEDVLKCSLSSLQTD